MQDERDEPTPLIFRSESLRLVDLCPPNHPDAPWLLRLIIIRDDIEFEFGMLWLGDDDGTHEVWRHVYALRRLSVSILEARAALAQDAMKGIKRLVREGDNVAKALERHVLATIATTDRACAALEKLRNELGGHVRPKAASSEGSCGVTRLLANAPNLAGSVVVGEKDLRLNHFRGLTASAFLMVWPDADSDLKVKEKLTALRDTIVETVPDLLHTIDTLVQRHMLSLGLIQPPPEFQLGVLTPKGAYKAL